MLWYYNLNLWQFFTALIFLVPLRFSFWVIFFLGISSKAFDSQDGKQLEESESTPSLLEQVQVSNFLLLYVYW